jgi:NAD(P)-dependent dehydrogenase (short-subunit alcohol dehydrogenase family)
MSERASFVITAASSDIARALIRRLDAQSDVDLLLVARSKLDVPKGSRHRWIGNVDLTREEQLEKLRTAASCFDGPFTIIHCAGDFWEHRPLVRTKLCDIRRMMDSHYLTLAATAATLLPLLVERRGGALVTFSCNSVRYNYPDMAPFTAAKAAVECFMRCVANEYSEFGIMANTLALPTILTPKVRAAKQIDDPSLYVTPDEVAAVILETIATASHTLNGNVLQLFRYSPSFFKEGYFSRNPRLEPIEPAARNGAS